MSPKPEPTPEPKPEPTPEPTVVGITAELANEFNLIQWINLYQLDPIQGEEQIHWRGKYQVKDLSIVLANQPLDQFILEPLDEQGHVISVQQALDNTNLSDGELGVEGVRE